jgi:hypothetical protein
MSEAERVLLPEAEGFGAALAAAAVSIWTCTLVPTFTSLELPAVSLW